MLQNTTLLDWLNLFDAAPTRLDPSNNQIFIVNHEIWALPWLVYALIAMGQGRLDPEPY